jgi:biotin carboxyl carrier protein
MKLRILVEGRPYEVEVDFTDHTPAANGRPRTLDAPIPDAVLRRRPAQRLPEDNVCRSPIAGRVTAVVAEAGRNVRRNEPVVILEAMKMEVPIGPSADGIVKSIHVAPGDAITSGQVLFELS